MRIDHQREHLLHAALEGVAFGIREQSNHLAPRWGRQRPSHLASDARRYPGTGTGDGRYASCLCPRRSLARWHRERYLVQCCSNRLGGPFHVCSCCPKYQANCI
jgi:hypothetical protein